MPALTKRKAELGRDIGGVSEIVGDILLVSIAVVMVSALALQMGSVQEPPERPMATLEAFYDGVEINVAHMGGDPLNNATTRFYVFVNDALTMALSVRDGQPSDDALAIGDNWSYPCATNASDRLRLQILDMRASAVVFDRLLQGGAETSLLPDIGLGVGDIEILRHGLPVDEVLNTPLTNETIVINATIHNYGGGGAAGVGVRVSDYSTLDRLSCDVMNQTLTWLGPGESQNISASYRIQNGSWGLHSITVKVTPIYNESRYSNNNAVKEYRVGYPIIATSPTRPYLVIKAIDFSDEHPVHGSSVIISARIVNQGGVPAHATIRYYDGGYSSLIGEVAGVGVPVGGEAISTVFWTTGSGGLHTIIVNVTEPNGTGAEASRQIEVLPTILLVDDDRASEGSVRDVVTPMSAALESVGATFTTHIVGGGDGPRYDSGDHPIRDYDLVIWMTGYETSNTLTGSDQAELTRFLYNHHGKLWLIGQGIVSDLGLSNPFLISVMNVDPDATLPSYLDAGTPDPIVGAGVLPGSCFNISLPYPTGLQNLGDFIEPRVFAAPGLVEGCAPNRPVAILFNATTNMTPGSETYTAALYSFELTRIKRSSDRSLLTYAMLDWFNCSARWGRDLSISEQEFNVTTPTFMDTVNITVIVRNNGLSDEPPAFISPILQVGFYVDGKVFDPLRVAVDNGSALWDFDLSISEMWIPQSTPHPALVVPGRGGYLRLSMVWVADQVGVHTVTVRVDPYDYIDEINELNNKVASAIANEEIFVRYGTLLVDDDDSANNGGALYNATYNLSRALSALGYDFDLVTVPGPLSDGPDLSKMTQYNAIIWCSGEAQDALTAADKSNLQDFLKRADGRCLWLNGQKALLPGYYGNGSDPFYRDFLRVSLVADPSDHTPSVIEGVLMDPVTHGVRYPAQPTFTDKGGLLVPYVDGIGILFQSPLSGASSERALCDAEDGGTEGWFARYVPPGTSAAFRNAADPSRGSRVIVLNRTGAHVDSTIFIVGDFSPTNNQNPSDLFWDERSRLTARWSFRFATNVSFGWHVTDSTNAHHTLLYSTIDTDSPGPNPDFGIGSWTGDGAWHSVTRDLTRDLRVGTGNFGLGIKSVDGFEVWMGEGEGAVDDISLCRPFNSVRYDNATSNFRTIYTAWDPSFISYDDNDNYITELTFMVMKSFQLYESRVELRVTHMDLFYSNMTPLREMSPMMGESYVLKAMVWNLGGTRGDAVVRFTDGSTVIDSVTVSVDASSRALAEIVWTPLFAGLRTIGATVDPDNAVGEVMEFNNVAGVSLECYFFYDDLESGPKNWRHDATILRINGESPLEYLGPGATSTSIIQGWAQMDGWYNTTDNASLRNITSVYRSWPRAFYMHESRQDIRKPVDCVIILDRSGSMGGQKIQDAKNAAMFFITQLEPIDRVSVWSFSSDVTMNRAFTLDKGACISSIRGLSAWGATAGWTAMYQGTDYCIHNSRPGAMRAVVFLTDGQFNHDYGMYTKANTLALISTMHGPLFTIGLGGDVNTSNLIAAANASEGGSYYYAPTSVELLEIYNQIAQVIQQLAQSLGRSTPEGGAVERAQVQVLYDSFESDTPAWTINNGGAAGSTWVRHSGVKHNGTYAYRSFDGTSTYQNNDDNSLISPVFDLYGRANPRLAFWSRPDLGNTGDWCRVYVSNDGGTSWTEVWSVNVDSNYWQYECYIDLTASGSLTMTSSMRLRFRFTSDNSNVAGGWVVDEVLVTYEVQAAAGEGARYWMNGDETPRDRNLTTQTFSLAGATSAKLSFWQKYDLKAGGNGGVLLVGTAPPPGTNFTYRYITPTQPYTGNLQISQWGSPHLMDGLGNSIRWCWNGVSGSGRFTWDYVEADLTPFVGNQYVRVRFAYIYCTGGTGVGWAIDDIEVRVERSNSLPASSSVMDQWELVRRGETLGGGGDTADAFSGEWAWLCHSPSPGVDYLAAGIDNSLMTIPIDLTNANDARLDARLKFNINGSDGRPPDGFRVEVSSDNGVTWCALNRGVRAAWRVSGTEAPGPDGTSDTGVELRDNWVASGSLSRLNCDLSGWAGSVILLRFRVVTRTDLATHYESALAGFGGVYVDDISVVGNTSTGGRGAEGPGKLEAGAPKGGGAPGSPPAPPESGGAGEEGAGAEGSGPGPGTDGAAGWGPAVPARDGRGAEQAAEERWAAPAPSPRHAGGAKGGEAE
ncbi:MAG: CARDB domain-containing protein [Thermoplasmatota archaeon]